MTHRIRLAALGALAFAAAATSAAPLVSPELATLAARPATSTLRVMQPAAQTFAFRQARQLEAGNAASLAAVAALQYAPPTRIDPKTAASMPCFRQIQTVDNQPSGQATLQPTQNLLVTGCFGDAPPTAVTVRHDERNLSWAASVIQRGNGFIYARLPDVSGVPDGNASVTVTLADGSASRVFKARFVAKRQTYELAPAAFGAAVRLASGVPEVCSFQSCYWDGPVTTDGSVAVDRATQTLSEHRLAARQAGYRLVGYWVGAVHGSGADGGFAADGSIVVRFGTEPAAGGRHVSMLRFDRLYVEGPQGLPPN